MIYLITNQTSLEVEGEVQQVDLDFCLQYLEGKKELGLDIETTRKYNKYFDFEGLDPYTSKIVMLQIGDLENQFIIDTRNVDISRLVPVFSNKDIMFIGHNIGFEYKHILHNYNVRLASVYDTMVMEQLLHNDGIKKSYALNTLNGTYLGITVDKSIRLGFLTIGDRPFISHEIQYGADDIINPIRIKEYQLIEAAEDRKDIMAVFRLEMRFLLAKAEMEYNGVPFSPSKWEDTYKVNLVKFQEKTAILNDFIITNWGDSQFIERQLDMFDEATKCNIQWTSSKQVIVFLQYLGICPVAKSKTTKKVRPTAEAKEVRALLLRNDLADVIKGFLKNYLSMKELEQRCTTFGIKFLKHVNPITGRIHSSYKQILNTGRISSSRPNNQNIPAQAEFRDAFCVGDDSFLINADYSGQESVILVNNSMDKDLLEFYDNGGGDLHSYTAQKIWTTELGDLSLDEIKSEHKDKRQIAKSANFALAYGGNGFTIASNLGISAEEGDRVYEDYFKAFPGLKLYFEGVVKKSLAQGYILIDSATRRKFFFPYINDYRTAVARGNKRKADELEGKMGRAAMNYCIQGAAGSMTKYAIVLIYEWLLQYEEYLLNIKLVLTVHDEVILEAKKGYEFIAQEKLSFFMEEAGKVWCKRIPIKADAVIFKVWGH